MAEKGLTIAEIAKAGGVSQQAVSNALNDNMVGRVKVHIQTVWVFPYTGRYTMRDRNHEGYHDLTASEAIRRAERRQKGHKHLHTY